MPAHVRNWALVRRIASSIHRRLPRAIDLDDLLADGFIGLHLARTRFDPGRDVPFDRFASSRIRGSVIDGLNSRAWFGQARGKKNRPRVFSLVESAHAAPSNTESENHRAQREALHRGLAALPRRDRLIVQLRFLESLTLGQIADCLGLSEARISQRLARTIQRLRRSCAR